MGRVKYHRGMASLSTLLSSCDYTGPPPEELSISSVVQHSAKAQSGSLFFAIDGEHTSGRIWAQEAVAQGAVAVVSEQAIAHLPVPVFVVPHIRRAYAHACAALYDSVHTRLFIIGVTGTDGKSTTCDYLHQILALNGIHSGLLSTISIDDGSGKRASPYRQSTPEADQLFAFLARVAANGLTHVIVECTSHALSPLFDRLGPITLDVALVTTVSSEHLDFHRSPEAYLDAKLNIVRKLKKGGLFVSSTANPALPSFLSLLDPSTKRVVIGRDIPAHTTAQGWEGVAIESAGKRVSTPLLLPVLATNALVALAAARHVSGKRIDLSTLTRLTSVKGRMECVPNSAGIRAVIDFAHTTDSYEKLFSAVQSIGVTGNLIVVMGAAGERDRSKRPAMGKIATEAADVVIITEEDPRGEDDQQIIADLLCDVGHHSATILLIPKRRAAIQEAIRQAKTGDVVLFLGKGHERSIQRKGETIAWNERAVVRKALAKKERIS